jgi:hypothetical protein
MRNTAEQRQDYWYDFVSRNLRKYLKTLSVDDVLQSTSELLEQQEEIATMLPKDANKILRLYISDDAVKMFSGRFRAEKYRKSKKKKTLQLQENTHKRLIAFKALLNADSIDEVIDYALSKKYENDDDIADAKEALGETISDIASFSFDGLIMRLTLNDKYKLYHIIKSVYQDAWKLCNEAHSDDPDSMINNMVKHQFMVSMMKDKVLVNEIEFYGE